MTQVPAPPSGKRSQKAPKAKQPKRRTPRSAALEADAEHYDEAEARAASRAAAAESVPRHNVVPEDFSGAPVAPQQAVANPYAVTGWRAKQRVTFDLTLPSGQVCLVARMERDDLLKLDLMQYLDTFTPILLEDTLSESEREKLMTDTVQENPEALQKMLRAIDTVVMACCLKPKITQDPNLVNYGNEADWLDPNFTPVALLDHIDSFERMYIFGAAFGRDMDDLKSVLQQTQSLDGVADVSGVQQDSQ